MMRNQITGLPNGDFKVEPEEDDDYIGSEQHFQDIVNAAGKTTAARQEPETLGEAAQHIADDVGELLEAFGFYRLADRILVAIGRLLIKMGFKNE